MTKMPDVVDVIPLDDFRLKVRFDDNLEGLFDLGSSVGFDGVFAPLKDPAYFAQVRVNPELGTVVWPNGADLDPVVLYQAVASAQRSARAASH
jgi:hypothetical protein